MVGLREEWDALWHRSRGSYIQTSACALHSWDVLEADGGSQLFCLVGRDDVGMLAVVWPLVVHLRALWRVARQLGPLAAEFTAVLVADTDHADRQVAAAWAAAVDLVETDVIDLPFVKDDSPLARAVASQPHTRVSEHDVAPYAHLTEHPDWKTYTAGLSARHRKKHRAARRKLAAQGDIVFEVVEGPDTRTPALVSWMLTQKRVWSTRSGKTGGWVFDDRYREVLTRLATDPNPAPPIVLFVLHLDGNPIAVKVAAVGRAHLDLIIAGYAPAHASHSPGTRLDEYWVPWAFARRLDVDFGAGGEHYKQFWSQGRTATTTRYMIPTRTWGRAGMMTQQGATRGQAALRDATSAVHRRINRAASHDTWKRLAAAANRPAR